MSKAKEANTTSSIADVVIKPLSAKIMPYTPEVIQTLLVVDGKDLTAELKPYDPKADMPPFPVLISLSESYQFVWEDTENNVKFLLGDKCQLKINKPVDGGRSPTIAPGTLIKLNNEAQLTATEVAGNITLSKVKLTAQRVKNTTMINAGEGYLKDSTARSMEDVTAYDSVIMATGDGYWEGHVVDTHLTRSYLAGKGRVDKTRLYDSTITADKLNINGLQASGVIIDSVKTLDILPRKRGVSLHRVVVNGIMDDYFEGISEQLQDVEIRINHPMDLTTFTLGSSSFTLARTPNRAVVELAVLGPGKRILVSSDMSDSKIRELVTVHFFGGKYTTPDKDDGFGYSKPHVPSSPHGSVEGLLIEEIKNILVSRLAILRSIDSLDRFN